MQWLVNKDMMSCAFTMELRNKIFYAKNSGGASMMGLRFKPPPHCRFYRVPVVSLLNTVVPATNLFGADIDNWTEQLYAQPTDHKKISLLEALLPR